MDPLSASFDLEVAEKDKKIASLRSEIATLTTKLATLHSTGGGLGGVLARALQAERECLAVEAAAAKYSQDQRTLWLRSPDCVLQVLRLVAHSGHPAWNFASLSRSFRGDEVLWGCIKDRRLAPTSRTSIMACCITGDLARVRWLLSLGADVHAPLTPHGATCLALACESGHLEVVRELLGNGADVRVAYLLQNMCSHGRLEIVQALLEANFPKKVLNDSLAYACIYGRLEIARMLLERSEGAFHLTTSLLHACSFGYTEVARLLLANGASKTAVDSDGKTPYMLVPEGNQELRDLMRE